MSCLSLFRKSRSGSQNGDNNQTRPTFRRAASSPSLSQYARLGEVTSTVPPQVQRDSQLLEKGSERPGGPTRCVSLDDSHGQTEYLQDSGTGGGRVMSVNVGMRPAPPQRGVSAESGLGMGGSAQLPYNSGDLMGKSGVRFPRSGSSSSIGSSGSGRGALKRPELPTIPDQQPLQEVSPTNTYKDAPSHLTQTVGNKGLSEVCQATQPPDTTPSVKTHSGQYVQIQDVFDEYDVSTMPNDTIVNSGPGQVHCLSSTPSTPSEKPDISPFNTDPHHNLRGALPFNGTNSAATTPSVADRPSPGYFGPDANLRIVPSASLRTTSTSASLKPGTTTTVFLPAMGSGSSVGNVAGSGDSQPIKVELHFDKDAREAHFTASTIVGGANEMSAGTKVSHQLSVNQDMTPEPSSSVSEPINIPTSVSPGFTIAALPTPPITNSGSATNSSIPEVHFHQHHHFLLSSAPSGLSDQVSPISLVASSTPVCEQSPNLRTPSKMPTCYNFPQTPTPPPPQSGPHVPVQVPDQYFPQTSFQPPLQLPISLPVHVSPQAPPHPPPQSYFQLPIQPPLQAPPQPPTSLDRPFQQITPERDQKIEFCHDGHGGGSYQPVPALTPLSETITPLPESTSLKKEKREKAITEKKRIALRRAASMDASKTSVSLLQSDGPSEYEWDDPEEFPFPFLNPRKSLDCASIDSWDAIDQRDEESVASARRERHRALEETKTARALRKGKNKAKASSHMVWDGGGRSSRRRSCGSGCSRPSSLRSRRDSSADATTIKSNSGNGSELTEDDDGHCTLDCDGQSCHLIESMEVRAEEAVTSPFE